MDVRVGPAQCTPHPTPRGSGMWLHGLDLEETDACHRGARRLKAAARPGAVEMLDHMELFRLCTSYF